MRPHPDKDIISFFYGTLDREDVIDITLLHFSSFEVQPEMINVDLMSTFEIKSGIDKKDMSSCLSERKYLRNWTFLFNSCNR